MPASALLALALFAAQSVQPWTLPVDLDLDGAPESVVATPERQCDGERGSDTARTCPMLVTIVAFDGRPLETIVDTHQPQVLAVEDLDGDTLPELVLGTTDCGAHTCNTQVRVYSYDGQSLRDRLAQQIGMLSATVRIEPAADGGKQIVLHGGTVNSVGAGLQRSFTRTYGFDATGLLRLASEVRDPDPDPYFRVLDANAALARGDLNDALVLAEAARAGLGEPNDDLAHIGAYAAIEQMLVYARRGQPDALVQTWADILAIYDEATNPYVTAGRELGRTFNATGDAVAACQAMASVVQSNLTAAQLRRFHGYNEEQLPPNQICPW